MKKLLVVIIVWVLLLAGAAYRFIQVLPYPLGGGRYSESPDKRFTAYASSMTEKEFWGGQRDYYEFRIQSAGGQTIRRVVMDPPGGEMISWRDAGSIAWAADSSAVTYSFQGMDVTLKLR